MDARFLKQRQVGGVVDEVPVVSEPFAPSDPLSRPIRGYQALRRIVRVLATLQVEVQDRGSNGQLGHDEFKTEKVGTARQIDLADSEVVFRAIIFIAFVVLQLELAGCEPDKRQDRAGLGVVGLDAADSDRYGVHFLLEDQMIDLITDFPRPAAIEAMDIVGLGFGYASNQLGDGVVGRHGRLGWPCLGGKCGNRDWGVFVCAKARQRGRAKKELMFSRSAVCM